MRERECGHHSHLCTNIRRRQTGFQWLSSVLPDRSWHPTLLILVEQIQSRRACTHTSAHTHSLQIAAVIMHILNIIQPLIWKNQTSSLFFPTSLGLFYSFKMKEKNSISSAKTQSLVFCALSRSKKKKEADPEPCSFKVVGAKTGWLSSERNVCLANTSSKLLTLEKQQKQSHGA